MRIVAGDFRGRHVQPVPGDSTRPTTDRVREAIASSITSARDGGFAGARMLDAFAGSGAVGIEALSRGAASCTFVDNDAKATRTIEANLAQLPLVGRNTRVLRSDLLAHAGTGCIPGGPFDIVFLDPPYSIGWEEVCRIVTDLDAAGAIAPGAVVAYERASGKTRKRRGTAAEKKQVPPEVAEMADRLGPTFELTGFRNYGITQVVYFKRLKA